MRVGDVFLGANGELSTLTNIVRIEQSGGIAVFNFEVEGNHNYFVLAKEDEFGQTCILVHNAKYKEPLVRRKQAPGDLDMNSEAEALREAMRQHGVPVENMDLYERAAKYAKNKPPTEMIDVIDANGDIIQIKHHLNGHKYRDNKTFEIAHYHGPEPDKVHICYPGGQ